MKIFIDLGAYDGDTILKAKRKFKDINKFIGFEPAPDTYMKLLKRVGSFTEAHNKAASTRNGLLKLYTSEEQMGHSLISSKRNVGKDYIEVVAIDFVSFLDQFEDEDEIILKVDIEGAEYDLFRKLIDSPKIKLIKKIYCEWHAHKIGMSKEEHNEVVKLLRDKGFKVTGNNINDEFKE